MQTRFNALFLLILVVFPTWAWSQSDQKGNTYRHSFTFGFNQSAFMTKVNGQPNYFPHAGSPAFRTGLSGGYFVNSPRFGPFEIEAGLELNHHVLKPSRQSGSFTNPNWYRILYESNIVSSDIAIKLFISPQHSSRFRLFAGYRIGVPLFEFFWSTKLYQRDPIMPNFLSYGRIASDDRFEHANFINHFFLFGTDYRISDRWRIEANFNGMMGIWLRERSAPPPLNYRVERYFTNFQLIAKYSIKYK